MKQILANVRLRADAYKLLSECYYLPDDELMQKIDDAARADPFFAELACRIPPVGKLGPLKVDYAALFVGPYKLLAPPYGSVYLEDSRMMGDSTIDVRNCYENEGLNITIKDAPDHIAAELEFMYYLVVKQIEAVQEANLQILQSYEQRQCSFLRTHLARWVPRFAENVRRNAQTSFYRDLAGFTEIFIRKDVDACA
ncbi:MAG: molecular chaperone TorD family protein [Planctomycetes bacterium]|jgi:TorA maturation chaperone TorD|nr:molecular chaperone TorD family protein [Planctomycetota bacterium]